jgi:dienelactone hydrolase
VEKPYQTVIYFPGVGARDETSSINLHHDIRDFYDICDFIIKNGRALMYPVYLDTYERGDGVRATGLGRYQNTELKIKQVKDFRRSIDYLETRPDIDTENLAYYGLSWGGSMGVIISAVEDRLKVSILYTGGLSKRGNPPPERNPLNFAPRIRKPILMLNGKYDTAFPLQISQIPLYKFLGTPETDKYHKIYETGHFIPKNELIKEVLTFLDWYLGPVK